MTETPIQELRRLLREKIERDGSPLPLGDQEIDSWKHVRSYVKDGVTYDHYERHKHGAVGTMDVPRTSS